MQRLTRHEHQGKLETPSPGSNPSATETDTGFTLALLLAAQPAPQPLPPKALGRWGLFKVRIAPYTPGK